MRRKSLNQINKFYLSLYFSIYLMCAGGTCSIISANQAVDFVGYQKALACGCLCILYIYIYEVVCRIISIYVNI